MRSNICQAHAQDICVFCALASRTRASPAQHIRRLGNLRRSLTTSALTRKPYESSSATQSSSTDFDFPQPSNFDLDDPIAAQKAALARQRAARQPRTNFEHRRPSRRDQDQSESQKLFSATHTPSPSIRGLDAIRQETIKNAIRRRDGRGSEAHRQSLRPGNVTDEEMRQEEEMLAQKPTAEQERVARLAAQGLADTKGRKGHKRRKPTGGFQIRSVLTGKGEGEDSEWGPLSSQGTEQEVAEAKERESGPMNRSALAAPAQDGTNAQDGGTNRKAAQTTSRYPQAAPSSTPNNIREGPHIGTNASSASSQEGSGLPSQSKETSPSSSPRFSFGRYGAPPKRASRDEFEHVFGRAEPEAKEVAGSAASKKGRVSQVDSPSYDSSITSSWRILRPTGEKKPDAQRDEFATSRSVAESFEQYRNRRDSGRRRQGAAPSGRIDVPASTPSTATETTSIDRALGEPVGSQRGNHDRRALTSDETSGLFNEIAANSESAVPTRRSDRFALSQEQDSPHSARKGPRSQNAEANTASEGNTRKARRGKERAFDEDDDERRPRRGRRAERDFDEESLDDSGINRIRDQRDQERKQRQLRARKEQRRNRELAAKRAQALTKITLPQFITVSRLAQALSVKMNAMVDMMESHGLENTAHDYVLSAEDASMIALDFNFDPTIGDDLVTSSRDLVARPLAEDSSDLPNRPPIVTIMGHVDHGKTTILDYLRKSSIAAGEHGGITQHIGAFSVRMSGGKVITFLDTPGHAAFLSMRQRGANVTDIVVLVVAADDSVKPQTLEALKHATAANVPIIVAVNKIDKPEADLQRVKQDLSRHGVEIEDFGGDVQVVPVSGKTGQGMDDFEEAIVTLGEILDHRAETTGLVEGWIIEATTKLSGRVATVLVKRGTLRVGDIIVAGQTWTKVRSLHNEAGATIAEAGPGTPAEVDGWRDQPMAGDLVLEATSEQKAADVASYRADLIDRRKLNDDVQAINQTRRLEQERREREKADAKARDEGLDTTPLNANGAEQREQATSTVTKDGKPHVNFIVKADVSGSVEAVTAYLQQLTNPLCSPRIIRSGVGPVSEFDVEHAAAAQGAIITFNLPTPAGDIASLAAQSKVNVIEQNVIYRLLDRVREALQDHLLPIKVQRVTGEAEVLKVFDIGIGGRKKMRIAGCRVTNGEVKRNARVRVFRRGTKVYDGVVASLKNVKKDVTEMRKGTECGIGFEDWTESQEGDEVQVYTEIDEKRPLPV